MKTPLAVLAVALLAPALAGCTSPAAGGPPDGAANDGARDRSCRTVDVPRVRAGASFTYEATGRFSLVASNVLGILDWGAVEPDGERKQMDLPPGSRVRVAVAERQRTAPDLFGRSRPVFQATYWVDHADRPPLAWTDELIDAETGQLVGPTGRAEDARGGDLAYTRTVRPWNSTGLFFSPMVWDRPLREGTTWTVAARSQDSDPKVSRRVRGEVTGVTAEAGRCRATVRFTSDYTTIEGGPYQVTATFGERVGLPLDWSEFGQKLVAFEPGNGSRLPAFRTAPVPDSAFATAPPRDGFFAPGTRRVFPTAFDRAVAAIENATVFRAWFAAHPDARPAKVDHRMGHPDGSVVDQWEVVWLDPSGRRIAGLARRMEDGSMEVQRFTFNGDLTYPNLTGPHVTLSALARLYEEIHGKPPEVLDCSVGKAHCWIGTHLGIREWYACEQGCPGNGSPPRGAPFIVGVSVDMARGLFEGDFSYDRDGLFPAAGEPPG